MGQSTLSHLHHRKRKREFKGVRKMASSTLIHTLVIKGPDSHFKSTPSATKLVGIVDRMDMKLESKLLSPLVNDTQLFKRLKRVWNMNHTTHTQKNSV